MCVAISGGVDSTTLLHYLKKQEKQAGFFLSAVHCEHGIRGEESLADAAFVQKFCETLGVPLFTFSENCLARAERERVSLETAARNFRRECFLSLVESGKVDYIATAHHALDEAETVLFRLARGASLSGASGLSAQREKYMIRPLLSWTKQEIENYALENGLTYRVDSTNLQTDATRNKLRLNVFPALENAVPNASVNLARFARLASEDDELLYALCEPLLSQTDFGYAVQFSQKKPLFRRACLLALKALGVEKDYTSTHLESAFLLQNSERGARLDLPCGVIAEKTETGISFFLSGNEEKLPPLPANEKEFSMDGFDGGRYAVNVCLDVPKGAENVLRLDKDRLPKDATFRFRKDGDFLQSFGGKKSLKKFFNERKIPVKERAYLPLIAEKDGSEVFAICGVEISERVKITKETQCVLYITTQKKEGFDNGGSAS